MGLLMQTLPRQYARVLLFPRHLTAFLITADKGIHFDLNNTFHRWRWMRSLEARNRESYNKQRGGCNTSNSETIDRESDKQEECVRKHPSLLIHESQRAVNKGRVAHSVCLQPPCCDRIALLSRHRLLCKFYGNMTPKSSWRFIMDVQQFDRGWITAHPRTSARLLLISSPQRMRAWSRGVTGQITGSYTV